ncbi:MAG: SCP2 sterol-binding domain-containing protein [Hyphomicrobium sp.]|nr:SCP2 sterol-binding domain-containing protein [Hyphomicrobium sp.]
MRPLPLFPLEFALVRLLAGILERHPDLVGRLSGMERRRIAVEPDDLPFTVVLELQESTISLRIVRTLDIIPVHARIRGPLPVLIGLVDGVYDGDALFFSRDLVIEGDIEAVLALRNAIDDADVDLLGEVAATCAACGSPIDGIKRALEGILRAVLKTANRGHVQ